jgi:hypothetical protein
MNQDQPKTETPAPVSSTPLFAVPPEAAPAKVDGTTLGHALPREIERCQELLVQYAAIGPVGQFGTMMIKRDIAAAHKAMMEGDVIDMIRAYEALKNSK